MYESPEFQLAWANEIATHVAEHVIHLRGLRGRSQAEVAAAMGTSQSKVARIEGGDDNITLRTLKRLIEALEGRLRFAIEPRELQLPRWPNWWDMPSVSYAASPWGPEALLVHEDADGRRRLGATWTCNVATTLPQPALVEKTTAF